MLWICGVKLDDHAPSECVLCRLEVKIEIVGYKTGASSICWSCYERLCKVVLGRSVK